jgi:serine/threonine protein kinase
LQQDFAKPGESPVPDREEREAAAADPPPRPWPEVPGYTILGEIGQGGRGVVYRALHRGLKRCVALKMIQAGAQARPLDVLRFRREAEAVGRLQHLNIIQVYDIGESNGQPYFAMELVEGGTLRQHIKGTPQPSQATAQLIETLARAVQAMHEQGIIHRDLKPANILLSSEWRVASGEKEEGSASLATRHSPLTTQVPKITDFGLAKDLHEEVDLTPSREVLGTPSYMAPEQSQGTGRQVGPATDVYALGAILYELLTGRPPFRGPTAVETLVQVLYEEAVPPHRFQPKVPRDLETICLKCLEKEPTKRYASAAALADDLERFREGLSIQARPLGRAEHLVRWCRRKPVMAGLSATVLLLLLTLAAGGPVVAYREGQLRRPRRRKVPPRRWPKRSGPIRTSPWRSGPSSKHLPR